MRVGADDLGLGRGLVAEGDDDGRALRLGRGDHVVVGQHVALLVDDDAGADRELVRGLDRDGDDGRPDAPGDAGHRPGRPLHGRLDLGDRGVGAVQRVADVVGRATSPTPPPISPATSAMTRVAMTVGTPKRTRRTLSAGSRSSSSPSSNAAGSKSGASSSSSGVELRRAAAREDRAPAEPERRGGVAPGVAGGVGLPPGRFAARGVPCRRVPGSGSKPSWAAPVAAERVGEDLGDDAALAGARRDALARRRGERAAAVGAPEHRLLLGRDGRRGRGVGRQPLVRRETAGHPGRPRVRAVVRSGRLKWARQRAGHAPRSHVTPHRRRCASSLPQIDDRGRTAR